MEKSPLNFLNPQKSPWLPIPRPCRAPQPPPSIFVWSVKVIIPLDVGKLRIRPFFRKKKISGLSNQWLFYGYNGYKISNESKLNGYNGYKQ
jgi:hypothetical protein